MGMGAAKPGSTLPPQGGKGGVQQPVPPQGGKGGVRPPNTYPGMPLTPNPSSPFYFPNGPEASAQALNQGKGQGVPMGGMLGGGGNPMQPQRDLGYGNPPPRPTVPAQGGKGNMPLPADYQSRYGNYGFDSGLQNYLDQQYVGSTRDVGVNYQYDPTTQTFTGGTMSGQYNPIPLSVMQQAAGGNREVLSPYFQSRFPQTATQPQRDLGYGNQLPQGMPRPVSIQPGPNVDPIRPQRDLGYGNPPPRPQVMPRPVPQVMPRQPTPKPAPQVMPRGLAGLRGRR